MVDVAVAMVAVPVAVVVVVAAAVSQVLPLHPGWQLHFKLVLRQE